MRWNYNDEYRDEFSKGPHRDILIVPHGTKVTPVAGGPPEITSRVPLFNDDGTPQTSGGNFVMSDVDWVITNKDIVKEQFKYSYSLNPAENITFSSASSAMVQFTIRNNKEYNPDTDTWELDIPNLQYYSYYDKHNNLIIGELEGNYIIKVYIYINGDSSTLLCLGMFRVEEDKAVDNGYNRQITAYDFMATFRDMDIFNWYKRLFDGINKLDNDYIDATNKTGEEQKKPDDYDAEVNRVRKPSKKLYPNRDGRWTIGEALQDLINNLAAFDMIVWSDDGKTAMVGGTSTNPSAVGRDYGEGCGYSGYGMPIVIDPNILDKNAKPYTPTEPGQDEYEEYGYMKILELEFYPDPSVLKSGSLSMGKFLEDIGILAGRYPMIRPDKLIEDQTADYFDPRTVTDPKQSRYNTYEKCILTFKPLPTSKDDKTDAGVPKLQPEQQLSNHEIVKGFQHALFDVKDVMIVKIGMQDGEKIEYKILNKTQRKQAETNDLQTFTFSNNLFCSYLVDSSDDEEIKKLLPEYKKIKEKLFGKEKDNHNMTSGALFEDGYYNIKNRSYVPYTLTTYGDPVRDVGDRILINFEDKITGEKTQMYTYILERELSGIQKMMDTYKANGQITSPVFSNYQTGSTYQSGFGMNIQMLGYKHSYGKGSGTGGSSQGKVVGVSPSDLVSYLRNVGIRLLDEPLTASAKFVYAFADGSATYYYSEGINGYTDSDTHEWVETWDGIQPTDGDTNTHGIYWNNSGTRADPDHEPWPDWPAYEQPIDASQPFDWWYNGDDNVYLLYDLNGKWVLHDDSVTVLDDNKADVYKCFIEPADLKPGDTTNYITINGITVHAKIGECIYSEEASNIEGLTSFKSGNTLAAFYNYPGVWGTEPDYTNVDDFHNLIYYSYDDYGRYYASQQAVPRFVISPITIYYDKEYTDNQGYPGWINKYLIPYNPNTTILTINNHYEVNVPYGGHIGKCEDKFSNYNGDNYLIVPDIWCNTSNYGPHFNTQCKISVPSKSSPYVELKWEDPSDITTYEPTPATWKGTIVIRKEGSAPKHRWDGIEIIRTTTENKDAYKDEAYKDTTAEINKTYYYGFFPYYKAREQDGHNINFFRYTKVIEVKTSDIKNSSGTPGPEPVPSYKWLYISDAECEIENYYYSGCYYRGAINCSADEEIISEISDGYSTEIKLYGKINDSPMWDIADDYYSSDILTSHFSDQYIYTDDEAVRGDTLKGNCTYTFQFVLTDAYNREFPSDTFTITVPPALIIDRIERYSNVYTIHYVIRNSYEDDKITLYGKKNNQPSYDNTDDVVTDLYYDDTSAMLYDLDEETLYYFGMEGIDKYDSDIVRSDVFRYETPSTPKWQNANTAGDTIGIFAPVKLDAQYLAENGYNFDFGYYETGFSIDTTKVASRGIPINLQTYIDIGKTLALDASCTETIFSNGHFNIKIDIWNSPDDGLTFYYYINNRDYGQICTPDTSANWHYDGENVTYDFMFVTIDENEQYYNESYGAAAYVKHYNDTNISYWNNYSSDYPDKLYEYLTN